MNLDVLDAVVIDPRRRGRILPPYLYLTVKGALPSSPLRSVTTSWRGRDLVANQFGMFWHVDYTGNTLPEELVVSVVNVALPERLEKLVPVEVNLDSGMESLAMQLPRARRLLKRFGRRYEYRLSEVAARKSRIAWELDYAPLMCMHQDVFDDPMTLCADERISEVVNIDGVPFPSCRLHLNAMRGAAANLRKERMKR